MNTFYNIVTFFGSIVVGSSYALGFNDIGTRTLGIVILSYLLSIAHQYRDNE